MLCGIYDFWMLAMMFSINAIMNLMGLVMEVHNQTTKKTNWLSYNIGVFAGAMPWLAIFAAFFAVIASAAPPNFCNDTSVALAIGIGVIVFLLYVGAILLFASPFLYFYGRWSVSCPVLLADGQGPA